MFILCLIIRYKYLLWDEGRWLSNFYLLFDLAHGRWRHHYGTTPLNIFVIILKYYCVLKTNGTGLNWTTLNWSSVWHFDTHGVWKEKNFMLKHKQMKRRESIIMLLRPWFGQPYHDGMTHACIVVIIDTFCVVHIICVLLSNLLS